MTVLKVPDMNCEHCVERITKVLKEEELNFKVRLGDKTVEIDGDDEAVSKAIEAIEDIGFTPNRG